MAYCSGLYRPEYEVLFETTRWNVPNNTYLLHRGKLIAYIQAGIGIPIYMKTPMYFDKKNRAFVKLRGMPFDLSMIPD